MDGSRFDDLARSFSSGIPRRTVVSALAGSVLAVAFGRRAEAKKLCGKFPCKNACCNDTCCDGVDDVCTDAGRCCPASQTCGSTCCPPENVGCSVIDLGDGTVKIGCQCPEGQFISHGHCVPCHETGKTCAADAECCSGSCCNGLCCPSGQFCAENGTCTCGTDQVTCGDTCCPQDHICQDGKCVCGPDYL